MNNEEQQNNLTSTALPRLIATAPEKIFIHSFQESFDDAFEIDEEFELRYDQCLDISVPYIRADLAGQEPPQWKPIAEMPEELKDGRNWLLGYDPNLEQPLAVRWIARYQHWCDIHSNGHVITHWMPLPTAPQAEAEEGE